MVWIIVILLVNFILIPLIELLLAERARFFAEVVVYLVCFVWVIYTLFFVGKGATP